MTLAWYGHLKLQESGTSSNWPQQLAPHRRYRLLVGHRLL